MQSTRRLFPSLPDSLLWNISQCGERTIIWRTGIPFSFWILPMPPGLTPARKDCPAGMERSTMVTRLAMELPAGWSPFWAMFAPCRTVNWTALSIFSAGWFRGSPNGDELSGNGIGRRSFLNSLVSCMSAYETRWLSATVVRMIHARTYPSSPSHSIRSLSSRLTSSFGLMAYSVLSPKYP